jgi:hypothetical protein
VSINYNFHNLRSTIDDLVFLQRYRDTEHLTVWLESSHQIPVYCSRLGVLGFVVMSYYINGEVLFILQDATTKKKYSGLTGGDLQLAPANILALCSAASIRL